VAAKSAGWRNAKHAKQWLATLERHAFPLIGRKPVADIDTDDVLRVLRPIWARVPETASRLRQRIEAVLDDAAVRGLRPAGVANPARWRGHLAATLPPPKRVRPVRHHPALPWQDVPAFMAALAEREGITARAVAFAILTASRSGAVRLMRWREVDMEARMWTVPAAHMKARRAHRVPLSDAALAILTAMRPHARGPESLVFPGGRAGRPLSDMALSMLVGACVTTGCPRARRRDGAMRKGRAIVVHGFRTSFKGWSLAAGWPDTLSELALAHVDRDKVRAAYARDDLLDQRRPMMIAWAEHCAGQRGAVASLAAARVRRMTP
jgi:integrase